IEMGRLPDESLLDCRLKVCGESSRRDRAVDLVDDGQNLVGQVDPRATRLLGCRLWNALAKLGEQLKKQPFLLRLGAVGLWPDLPIRDLLTDRHGSRYGLGAVGAALARQGELNGEQVLALDATVPMILAGAVRIIWVWVNLVKRAVPALGGNEPL